MIFSRIYFFIILGLFFLRPLCLDAASYDFYVDDSAKENGTGSQSEPFKTIGEAIKEAEEKGGSRKIFIKNGTYEEDLEIEEAIKLYGESENGVIIEGAIKMEDDTAINDLTVKGGIVAITAVDGADIEIENCTIHGFSRVGIETYGKGKLKVTNSKIKKGNGKGFYIQRGKTIEIVGNEITGNDEEGIDIRSKVAGSIEGNLISNNGESGIEVIVGSADLTIKKNAISQNGSSGIATQFYPERDKKGKILIEENKLTSNSKFGLDCNVPHGGGPQQGYWRDSIELIGNEFSKNKLKAISDFCNFIDAVDEDEEKDNAIVDNEAEESEKEKIEESSSKEASGNESELEEEKRERESKLKEIELSLESQQQINLEIEAIINILENESKLKIFFFGHKKALVLALREKLSQKEKSMAEIDNKVNQIEFSESEEEIAARGLLDREKQLLKEKNQYLAELEKSFSLWGWLKGVFT